jgi:hypothetical protein
MAAVQTNGSSTHASTMLGIEIVPVDDQWRSVFVKPTVVGVENAEAESADGGGVLAGRSGDLANQFFLSHELFLNIEMSHMVHRVLPPHGGQG